MTEKLYTVEETASILHVTKFTIYRLVETGKLTSIRYHSRLQYFTRDAIQQYADSHKFHIEFPTE